MKILITGKHTTKHRQVSAMLADRLDMEYVSARNMVEGFCSTYGVTVAQFESHTDTNLDDQFNQCIVSKVNANKDCVCDCIGISKLPIDGIRIYLDKVLYEEVGDVSALYDLNKTEDAMAKKLFDDDVFKPNNYDLYINCNGKSPEYIVQWIVTSLQSGRIRNKGFYIPAYMCIPDTPLLPISEDAYYKLKTSFELIRYQCAYILRGDLTQAVLNAKHDELLYIPFDDYKVMYESPVELKSVTFYNPWFIQTKDPCGTAMVSLMLAKYCYTMESFNYDLAYTSFTVNGNPVKRLIELGYHN